MNININFKEKTLQIFNEISVEEMLQLIEKLPELKEFKIIQNTPFVVHPTPYPNNPWDLWQQPHIYPTYPAYPIEPYYNSRPFEVFCGDGLTDGQMTDSTAKYYTKLTAND